VACWIWRSLIGIVLLLRIIPASGETGTVNEIIAFVRASLDAHEPDQKLAKALHRIKPTERVDERVVEELERAEAGRLSIEQLERLHEDSQALPNPAAPPEFPQPAVPAPEEQAQIILDARQIALNYSQSLPDFICSEEVKRYTDTKGRWDLKDTVEL